MSLGRLLFGTKISFELKQLDDKDVHGEQADGDYKSYGALKSWVGDAMDNFPCPACGNHKVKGEGVIVEYGKVHLHRQVEYKGWFGGKKYKDERYKTVWRIHQIGLRNAPGRALLNAFGFFDDPPGEIKCNARGCSWSERGERGGTFTLGDLLRRPLG